MTPYAGLPNGRYLDPKTKQSFSFNHMTREASDWQTEMSDGKSEALRGAVQTQVEEYVKARVRTLAKMGRQIINKWDKS